MIHHISIAAENPLRVAQVLAEIWDGQCGPFPPHPGSYMVIPFDQYGTLIEIYPLGTELAPGTDTEEGAVTFAHNPTATGRSATHAAISVPTSQEKIEAIAAREGWRAVRCDREGFFEVIEFWVENRLLIELLPPAIAPRYLSFMQPESLKQFFENAPVAVEA